jgi:hypothetical protein
MTIENILGEYTEADSDFSGYFCSNSNRIIAMRTF